MFNCGIRHCSVSCVLSTYYCSTHHQQNEKTTEPKLKESSSHAHLTHGRQKQGQVQTNTRGNATVPYTNTTDRTIRQQDIQTQKLEIPVDRKTESHTKSHRLHARRRSDERRLLLRGRSAGAGSSHVHHAASCSSTRAAAAAAAAAPVVRAGRAALRLNGSRGRLTGRASRVNERHEAAQRQDHQPGSSARSGTLGEPEAEQRAAK